jgi:hypothetical protein
VREAQHAEPGDEELGVALAVALEGQRAAVVPPAVGLDDPAAGEEDVDLDSADDDVGLRPRQRVLVAEREERFARSSTRARAAGGSDRARSSSVRATLVTGARPPRPARRRAAPRTGAVAPRAVPAGPLPWRR